MQINLLLIGFLLLTYSAGSWVLLLFASEGWSAFIHIFSAPLFLVPPLIFIVGRFFRASSYVPMELLWTYLKLIVITLIFAILFNVGDDGDGGSGGYYYQTILAGRPGRYGSLGYIGNLNYSLFFITRLVYHGVLIAFAIYIAFIAKKS